MIKRVAKAKKQIPKQSAANITPSLYLMASTEVPVTIGPLPMKIIIKAERLNLAKI